MTTRILTGLRANGDFHLGNYLGSLVPMVQRQQNLKDDQELFMFLADLHSFTTPIDHSQLYDNIINNVRMYIAAGIDPNHPKTTIWRQSQVSPHSELAWILECFTYFGEAQRMTEFKDKSDKLGHKAVSLGLFNYPILMGADILLYGATYVPLGDDQKQHMELIRTVAERFNQKFGEVFVVPAEWGEQLKFTEREVSVRIKSLSNPEAKMSKSITDPKGTINLTDNPKEAAKKVMSATTDSVGIINYDPQNQPGISNLLLIASILSNTHLDDLTAEWKGKTSYGDLKKYVAELVEKFLGELQAKYEAVSPRQVEEILAAGELKANEIAKATLLNAQKAVGIRK